MKECLICKVKVNTSRKTCPLCGQILSVDDNPIETGDLYPKYNYQEKTVSVLLRIILFISLVSIFITVLINILTYDGSLWSIYIILGVLYGWILLRITIMSRQNIASRLLIQLITTSIVCYGIERVSDSSGWALDYVTPFLCMLTILSIVLIIAIKVMRYKDYLSYLLIATVISWIPIILYWANVITIAWPSAAAAGLSAICVLGMIVFADRATKDELKRRLHI